MRLKKVKKQLTSTKSSSKKTSSQKPRTTITSCGIIVFCEGKTKLSKHRGSGHLSSRQRLYLLLKYEAGHIDFPKGMNEAGESFQQTARRELKEETGITQISLIPGFKEQIKYFFRHNSTLIFKQVFFFLAKTQHRDVKLSFEHQEFYWLPYEEALKKITYPHARGLLEKAETFLS